MSSVIQDLDLDDGDRPSDGPAKDSDGVPYCRKHHCRMKQASGGKKGGPKLYYSCPVPGCEERSQKIKTPRECVVPAQPLECPRCSKDGKPVYCERDKKSSTAAMVILRCPRCQWKSSAMAVPQLAAAHLMQRQRPEPVEEIGSR